MTLVVTVDDSDHASTVLFHAVRLAVGLDERLSILHVPRRSKLVEVLEKDVEGQAFTDNYEVQRVGMSIVERTPENHESTHKLDSAEIEVRVSGPADAIVTYAEQIGARYVVIGGRQRSPAGKALSGYMTQQVRLGASTPVLNVPLNDA